MVGAEGGQRLMTSNAASLRVCGLALLMFLAAVVPFQWLGAEPFARLVLGGAALVTVMTGPSVDAIQDAQGKMLVVDRQAALRQFWDDPAQRPRWYGLLAAWSWIAAAPLGSLRARLWQALRAGGAVVGAYTAAIACNALAWYWRSLADTAAGEAARRSTAIVVVDGLGTVLSIAALFVLPLMLGLAAYPGLRFEAPAGARAARP